MKKIFLIVAIYCVYTPLIAQNNSQTGVVLPTDFHITRPISEIFAENPVDENKNYGEIESEDRKERKAQKFHSR